jgi:AraC-like DNA-binding protein
MKRKRPQTFAEQTEAMDDQTGPMGIRLLSQRTQGRTRLGWKTAALLLPLDTTRIEVSAGGDALVVDRSAWFLVPPGTLVSVTAKSPTAHTLILGPSRELVKRVAGLYQGEMEPARYERYVSTPQLLPRTTWVNELGHRYMFERAVCKKRDNDATRFLEAELTKELYFLCHERDKNLSRSTVVSGKSDLVSRALAQLEAHLFEPDVLGGLARACHTSQSTLLRAWKREQGDSPLVYLRARRLDEAMLLLKSGRYGVGEVSVHVGYGSFAAFSQAFRARFDVRPSDVVSNVTRPSTPPAGAN